MSQMALPLRLADHAVFASFHSVGNEELVDLLRGIGRASGGDGCWVWGAAATGKTHLLQALCDCAGDRSVYIPMASLAQAGPALIEGLESREIVCIDDIDSVVGSEDWEHALFTLYNSLAGHNGQLVVAAKMAPRECPVRLPDLASRLTQLPSYRLHALADTERSAALQLRASHRGLDLPEETAKFLLSRGRRDMRSLYGVLDLLDREALRAQRRLTVPFVSQVLMKQPLSSSD